MIYDEIPDWLSGASERVSVMYNYWRAKCRGASPPRRADIDPVDMPPSFLPFIIIVEAVPDERRYVYRLVGSKEVDFRGSNPTGKSVIEAFYGESVEEALYCYDTVVTTRRPYYEHEPYISTDGRLTNEEELFLPLSDDGQAINRVMVFCVISPKKRR